MKSWMIGCFFLVITGVCALEIKNNGFSMMAEIRLCAEYGIEFIRMEGENRLNVAIMKDMKLSAGYSFMVRMDVVEGKITIVSCMGGCFH